MTTVFLGTQLQGELLYRITRYDPLQEAYLKHVETI